MDSIVASVRANAFSQPDKTAVIANGEKITYKELWREIQGTAAFLRGYGFGPQSKIVVKVDQDIWFVVACFAIHLCGYIHVPMEKSIGVHGLEDVAGKLEASMVISDIEPEGDFVSVHSGRIRGIAKEYYRDDLTFEMPGADMICDILYTTGTTGKSKGVMLQHKAIVAVSENVWYGANIKPDNVYLVPTPLNHAGAIRKIYVSMLTGTTVVLIDGFMDVKKFFSYIRDYGVTSIVLPPSAVRMLLVLSGKEFTKYADQLDHIHTGAAAFPEADKERLSALLPNTHLYFAYGSSEAGCSCLYDYAEHKGKASCVGKPNKNAEVFIVDDDGQPVSATLENPGLIAVRGSMNMLGYYNEPELTAGTLRDGVVYTSDLGYIDEEGFLYVLGRRDDVINIGGLKIAPTEVEAVVLRYPGIADCACFAAQDRMGGAIPKLNIVPEKDQEINISDLKQFMANYLEAFKIPKTITVVESIPKTYNGKTDRKKLK